MAASPETVSEKVLYLTNSLEAIKQAIYDKGVSVGYDAATYAEAIGEISGGGLTQEAKDALDAMYTGAEGIEYEVITDAAKSALNNVCGISES